MEACNLLLSFRDLSFTGLQVLLMIYFFFPFHADLFPLFFFSAAPTLSSLLPYSFLLVIPVVYCS